MRSRILESFDLIYYCHVHSEKYYFLRDIQTKYTVHREGKESVQNGVLQSEGVEKDQLNARQVHSKV